MKASCTSDMIREEYSLLFISAHILFRIRRQHLLSYAQSLRAICAFFALLVYKSHRYGAKKKALRASPYFEMRSGSVYAAQ